MSVTKKQSGRDDLQKNEPNLFYHNAEAQTWKNNRCSNKKEHRGNIAELLKRANKKRVRAVKQPSPNDAHPIFRLIQKQQEARRTHNRDNNGSLCVCGLIQGETLASIAFHITQEGK